MSEYPIKLTEPQFELLHLWLDGSGSPRSKGLATGERMPWVRQLVRKGALRTQSCLPFVGRRQAVMTLCITHAGRTALKSRQSSRAAEKPGGERG